MASLPRCNKLTMKRYILLSISIGSLFGIIYNIIAYLFSNQIISPLSHRLEELFGYFLYKINSEALLNITRHEFSIIVLHGILTTFLPVSLMGLVLYFLPATKVNDNIKFKIWKKIFFFSLVSSLLMSVLVLVSSSLWAANNKNLSWFSKDIVFEKYYPAISMVDAKNVYLFIGLILGVLYFLKLRRKPATNTR